MLKLIYKLMQNWLFLQGREVNDFTQTEFMCVWTSMIYVNFQSKIAQTQRIRVSPTPSARQSIFHKCPVIYFKGTIFSPQIFRLLPILVKFEFMLYIRHYHYCFSFNTTLSGTTPTLQMRHLRYKE